MKQQILAMTIGGKKELNTYHVVKSQDAAIAEAKANNVYGLIIKIGIMEIRIRF